MFKKIAKFIESLEVSETAKENIFFFSVIIILTGFIVYLCINLNS